VIATYLFIKNFNVIQHASRSLVQLGFEEEADDLSQISFARSKKSVTLRELLVSCSRPVFKSIARRYNLDVDVDKFLEEYRKTSKGPVHLARNFYIFDKVTFSSFNNN